MKKILAVLVLVAMASVLAFAQGQTRTIVGPSTYTVEPGDTVWDLNPMAVEKIEKANPFLNDRRFTTDRGLPGLYIYGPRPNRPADQLFIPEGVTITVRNPGLVTPASSSTTEQPAVVLTPTVGVSPDELRTSLLWGLVPLALLLLLALLLGYLAYRALRNRMLDQDFAIRNVNETLERHDRNNASRHLALMREVRHGNVLSWAMLFNLTDILTLLYSEDRTIAAGPASARTATPQAMPNRVAASDTEEPDFVEVHRRGERFSILVPQGTSITSAANGVQVSGAVTILTQDAARAERDRQALLRQEQQAESMFAGI